MSSTTTDFDAEACIKRDYPNFKLCTRMTVHEFATRWRVVQTEATRAGRTLQPFNIEHDCTPSCYKNMFVSGRFTRTALCPRSRKMHVCELGGACMDTIVTNEGDIICSATNSVVGQENLLQAFSMTEHSGARYGQEMMGGINARSGNTSRSGRLTGGVAGASSSGPPHAPPEFLAALDMVSRGSLSCTTERLSGKRRADGKDDTPVAPQVGRKKGKKVDTVEVVNSTLAAILELSQEQETLTHEQSRLLREKVPASIMAIMTNKGELKPLTGQSLKAFVYAFLEILADSGVYGVQEGPMPELRAILPPPSKLHELHIDGTALGKAEHYLRTLLLRVNKQSQFAALPT